MKKLTEREPVPTCSCKWRASSYPSDIYPMTRILNPHCDVHWTEAKYSGRVKLTGSKSREGR